MVDDFKSLRRRVRNKLAPLPPRDSYPFISGDAYRCRCDFDLTKSRDNIEILLRTIDHDFFHTVFVGGEREGSIVLNYLDKNDFYTKWRLYFHNQDVAPSTTLIAKILARVDKIYSQGWLGYYESVKALPSGLENANKLRNGVPSDYSLARRKLHREKRTISVFASFKESNNLEERSGLKKLFSSVKDSYVPLSPLNPKKYRQTLLNSRYVISPPGNGPDCHRTWESIYLGAIPVVLRSSWPFTVDELPVLVVDSWQEALEIISSGVNCEFDTQFQNPINLWKRYVDAYFE